MDTYFYLIVAALVLLAVVDLFVGVSNDAVNFLNSAVGCRAAPYKTVLTVAGVGVLLGAAFSGGMMEIARTGIFHPAMFTFLEVMVIYFTVMVTDVLLLNGFNSLGLPTSTTVSIVFELLGAAAGTAAVKLISADMPLETLGTFINGAKSIEMIVAILVSVVVAFLCGALAQYVTRLIFTFKYEGMFRRFGGIYGGFCISTIFYFLVMKGAKSATFMTPAVKSFLTENSLALAGLLFVVFSVVLHFLMVKRNFNVFRFIILAGTFALAFSFAGNDLVNFIGVPIAAVNSSELFLEAGAGDPQGFMMAGLAKNIAPPTLCLIGAGVIMVATLVFSRSARTVIETSVNLSSSNSGEKEQFGASLPGRIIVRAGLTAGRFLSTATPRPVKAWIESRFEPRVPAAGETALPFDYIRASLNLIIASILIATATSLKLPLSTTYVTFMVAMGSSFADGAWDRESAVYRVSGVITVICGWFLTGFTAFTASCCVAVLLLLGGEAVFLVLTVLALVVIVKSNFLDSKGTRKMLEALRETNKYGVKAMLDQQIPENFSESARLYGAMIEGYLADDGKALRETLNDASASLEAATTARSLYYRMARQSGDRLDNDAKHLYYRSCSGMRDAARSLVRTVELAREHVANRHRILDGDLALSLRSLADEMTAAGSDIDAFCRGTGTDISTVQLALRRVQEAVDQCQLSVVTPRVPADLSLRTSELYLALVQFARDAVNRYESVLMLQMRLNHLLRQDEDVSVTRSAPAGVFQ